MDLIIEPAKSIKGTIKVPGDKSISHRALIIGSLTEGTTSVHGFLNSADCRNTLACLRSMGVEIKTEAPTHVEVEGVGLFGFKEPKNVLDVGNSGTTLRVLPGILAGQNFTSVLTGDDSVRKRPVDRIIQPLRQMGADISAVDDRYAPITITGRPLSGITYDLPVASAQVKTAVLLAGLLADGETTVKEGMVSRDHTEKMLQYVGAEITQDNGMISVKGKRPLKGSHFLIPGDISSAAFFIIAALITQDSSLTLRGVGVNPTRLGVVEVLIQMGARIDQLNWFSQANEPRADLVVQTSELSAVTIDGDIVPRLIDELPIVAVAATQAEGVTIVKGARELRIKETDRIAAITSELSKMGAAVEEQEDGFIVTGPCQLRGAVVSSFGDHRMAMALAVAGLVAQGRTVVTGSECIDVSFPGFEQVLRSVAQTR
jgi:3-phosphoshikimate 1-carboxyvinyltransferase